jgi:hypothetical protein
VRKSFGKETGNQGVVGRIIITWTLKKVEERFGLD